MLDRHRAFFFSFGPKCAETPGMGEDRRLLKQWLTERNRYPEKSQAVDARIRQKFEREVALFNLDMSGFSRLARDHGIIHFLAMITEMEAAAVPAVVHNGGQVLKQEADNLFALFTHPEPALEAALDCLRAFQAMNEVLPETRHLHGSIGIGFGSNLVIGDEDVFGVEMNYASKLGEDLAARNEILLTNAAWSALPPGRFEFVRKNFDLGGESLAGHSYVKRAAGTRHKAA